MQTTAVLRSEFTLLFTPWRKTPVAPYNTPISRSPTCAIMLAQTAKHPQSRAECTHTRVQDHAIPRTLTHPSSMVAWSSNAYVEYRYRTGRVLHASHVRLQIVEKCRSALRARGERASRLHVPNGVCWRGNSVTDVQLMALHLLVELGCEPRRRFRI